MRYEIINIHKLRPLEKVFPYHFKNLEDMINRDKFILKALIVDENTGIILDGSHRYVYFLKYGFKRVPVHFVNYEDDDIRVGTRLSHRFLIDGDVGISKRECVVRALSNKLFPPRTTRHFFPFRKIDIALPLDNLEKGEPVDISHLLYTCDIGEEIEHNEEYINEIDEEFNIIINYLSEVNQTKEYLLKQIQLMKDSKLVAFFPGKFHPPHIGHIISLLKVLPKYKKVVIGVTEDKPNLPVSDVENIVDVLKMFFKGFDNVEVVRVSGVLTEKDGVQGLPEFDVLLSGNNKVLSWAKKYNVECQFIPRTEGFLYSGTDIRSSLREDIK